MTVKHLMFIVLLAIFLSGCASTSDSPSSYDRPNTEQTGGGGCH